MAEEVKSTRGRKKTTQVDINNIDNTNTESMSDIMAQMLQMKKEMEQLQKQLSESKNKVKNADKEKSELQQLVEALQTQTNNEKVLPKKVKVMSLIPNKYNLTTEVGGSGKQFTFDEFGDVVTMKTTELEEILSIQKQREQAENGWFYILDKDIVEDQELQDSYQHISDKETLEHLMKLDSDECVDIFCGLSTEMQESLSVKMAENLLNGIKIDRNRISDISMRTDIDIDKIAEQLKKSNKNNK